MVVRPAPPPPAWWSCKKLIPGKKLMADREAGQAGLEGGDGDGDEEERQQQAAGFPP